MTSQAVSAQHRPFASLRKLYGRHSAALKKTAYVFLFMLAGFALARAELMLHMSPFGPAFVAACFFTRRFESLFAAAGVCLGALLAPQNTLHIVMVTLLICGALVALGQIRLKRWVVLMAVSCAYAVSAAVFKTASLEAYLPAVLECLVALVMFYVLSTLIEVGVRGTKRSLFSVEETICLALGALTAVCLFGPLNIAGVYIAYIAAYFMVLCVAFVGGPALGAGVGLALGLALCLGISAEAAAIGMMGIAGMLAGTIRKLGKAGVAIGFSFAVLLYIAAFYTASVWYLALIEAGAGALLFLGLPRKALLFAGRYIDIKARRDYEHRLHTRRFKELTVGRLLEVSEVFVQTGDMFVKEAQSRIAGSAHISAALSVVADSTCKDCVFKKSCWDRDFLSTYGVFSQLFSSYEKNGQLTAADIEPAFAKKCYNVKGILSASQSVFGAYLVSRKWQKKLEDACVVTGQQLKGVARVVADLGREMDTGFKFLPAVEEKVACALDGVNVRAREVCAESMGGGMAVGVKIKSSAQSCGLERVISGACGVPMQKARETVCGRGAYRTLRFEQARTIRVDTAVAAIAKDGVSGDSYASGALKDGRYLMMLCDGMGSGESARRESAAAVSLVENFFRAGFDDAVVFDTINRILMLRGNDDIFSTVDLCVLDCKSGAAKFIKIGAECAYILNREGVATVLPGSLPIGIIDDVAPASTERTLLAEDMVVMLSDGVADAIDADPEKWFADIPQDDAQQAAEAILAKARRDGPPADDMTVMVSLVTQA